MFGGQNPAIDVILDEAAIKDASDAGALELLGSIDQGTSSTRFLVFTKRGTIAASAQMEHKQYFPSGEDKVGWHEHDPLDLWFNTVECMKAVQKALKTKKIDLAKKPLLAIGITNQRETTLAWNAETGVPYFNAIVWDDLRTTSIASDISQGNVNRLRDKTGLPLASYFAGTKVKWLLDNVPGIWADLANPKKREQVRFGTVDSWLLYQLTGQPSPAEGAANCGGIFVTDVSNASRWLFLNIHTLEWDQELIDTCCAPHSVPASALPKICSSSQVYAKCGDKSGAPFPGVPLASIVGDQQAALFGQCAFSPGEAKCTYGTGSFLMMNTGDKIVPSENGLLTTVAYQIGENGPVKYALEGSVSHSGSTIQWLRDQLGIIAKAAESETLARETTSNDGLYFVPAFSGLFAPHWRPDARACIVGMTATHTKAHICRAALEAAAYQTREVFDAMYNDSNVLLKELKVDGGGTANKLLMQFQADMIDVNVVKPAVMETTARGAVFAAGLAVGVWKDEEELRTLWAVASTFEPSMDEEEQIKYWQGWQKAVSKSLDWEEEHNDRKFTVDMDDYADEGYETADGYETATGDEDDQILDTSLSRSITAPVQSGYGGLTLLLAALVAGGVGYMIGRNRK